jgi:hypothetical protein
VSGRRPSTSISLGRIGIVAFLALLAIALPLLRPKLTPAHPERLLARCASAAEPASRASCYREQLYRIAYQRTATPREIGRLCRQVGDPECAKAFGAVSRGYADCLEFARGYAGGFTLCVAGLQRW